MTAPHPAYAAAPTASANAPVPPSCETSGNALAFILCPIYDGLTNVASDIFNDIIAPFLYESPISTNPKDPGFMVWSTFRVYGDIFLVLALLVAVMAEAIGGGAIDAYTVRKILPRVLLTAILINLSIYIVALLVDITNIVGRSLSDIITTPLQSAGAYNLAGTGSGGPSAGSIAGAAIAGIFTVGVLSLFLKSDKFTGFVGAVSGKTGGEFGKSALFLMMMVLIPIVIAILAIFFTLIIRKGLILFLLMISPVAFALYVLPNTEKYFRKWWDLLLEALLVYPIIVAIFAIADVMSVTVLGANGVTSSDFTIDSSGNVASTAGSHFFAIIIAFFLQFIPLLAIPFAFRMAGGTLSRAHELATNAGGKLKESGWYGRNREKAAGRFNNAMNAGKRQYYTNKLNSLGSMGTGDDATWAGRRYRRHVMTQLNNAGGTQAAAEKDAYDKIAARGQAHNPEALMAGIAGRTEGEALTNLQKSIKDGGWGMNQQEAERAVAAWNSTQVGWGGAAQAAALKAAVDDGTVFTGRTQTIKNADGTTSTQTISALQQQSRAIATVAGGDEATLGRVAGEVYAGNKRAGRAELSESFGTVRDLANLEMHGTSPSQEEYDKATYEGWRGITGGAVGQQKGAGVANASNAMASHATAQAQLLNEATTQLQRSDLSAEQRAHFETQANDAQVELVHVKSTYDGIKRSGMYMPDVHTQQIEAAVSGAIQGGQQSLDDYDRTPQQVNVRVTGPTPPAPQPGTPLQPGQRLAPGQVTVQVKDGRGGSKPVVLDRKTLENASSRPVYDMRNPEDPTQPMGGW